VRIEQVAELIRGFNAKIDFEYALEISYRRFLRAGDRIIDIGANVGDHTARFLDVVGAAGRVIAFEPLPDVHTKLVARFAGRLPAPECHQIALSSAASAEVAYVRAEGALGYSGLRQRVYDDPNTKPIPITVRVETLDRLAPQLALDSLRYMKIDIEGGELDALNGGRELIERHRPFISVEWGSPAYSAYGHEEDSLFRWASRFGYALFDPFLNFVGTRDLWDLAKARYCWDYFLIPTEQSDVFRRRP
jgi:FkbM family methyltransferase